MMAVEVFNSVLAFSVNGFVKLFDNLCASRLRLPEVRIDIVDEDGEALCSVSKLCRALQAGTSLFDHDDRAAGVELSAAERGTVAVVHGKPESGG